MKIQYRTMYKLIMALLALSAALLIAGYSVLRPDISANQKEGSRLIGASYMTMNNEFYEILNEQISHRVEAEGDRLILRNPALSDPHAGRLGRADGYSQKSPAAGG